MEDKESALKSKGVKIEHNCIFSEENVNVGNQPEIDYLKTLGVFLMIYCHFYEEFSRGFLFKIVVFMTWILKGGTLMLLMGIGMKYSRHHEPKNYFSRGIILLTLSQLVNFIRDSLPNIIAWRMTGNKKFISRSMLLIQGDILTFCGLSFFLLALMKKMNLSDRLIIIIGTIMNLFGYILYKIMKSPDNFLLSQFLGYFVSTNAEAFFPLCSYFIFVAVGYWLGGIYQKISNKNKFYNLILIFGFPISIIYHYFRIYYDFPMLPEYFSFEQYCLVPGPDWVITCINCLLFLALFYKLHLLLKSKTPEFVLHASKNMNQYYIISYTFIMQMQTFMMATRGEQSPFSLKYSTLCGFLIIVFCRILINMNDKYIHFTITTLKNQTRNFVFALIWINNIITLMYIYPKVEVFATMWNDYLVQTDNENYLYEYIF